MVYTAKIQEAVRFAIGVHEVVQKQKRKGKDIPYITHPLTVGLILARAGASEDVICAGVLHDTLEDSVDYFKVTKETLAELFGETVAELVDSVTEKDKSKSWEVRKREALEHIRHFSNDSILVKAADVLSNNTELVHDYGLQGETVWERFTSSKENILENTYLVIGELIEAWPESPLVPDLRKLTNALFDLETKPPEGSKQGFFIGKDYKRKLVRYLSNEELPKLTKLGSGGSPRGITLAMASKHSPNFYEKVVGFQIEEHGVGEMIHNVMKKDHPDHVQAQEGMSSTYTFYGLSPDEFLELESKKAKPEQELSFRAHHRM